LIQVSIQTFYFDCKYLELYTPFDAFPVSSSQVIYCQNTDLLYGKCAWIYSPTKGRSSLYRASNNWVVGASADSRMAIPIWPMIRIENLIAVRRSDIWSILVAAGMELIGGGEPENSGISIGHK